MGLLSMMVMLWQLALPAVAAETLDIEVVTPPPRTRGERLPSTIAMPSIPVGEGGEITVDGRLDEDAWQQPAAPPLSPRRTGPAPPDVSVRVHLASEGLAIGVSGLPEDHTAAFTIDPNNTGLVHWKLDLEHKGGGWRRCDFGDQSFPFEVYIATRAFQCTEVAEGRVAADQDWEALLPWDEMRPSENLRMALVVQGRGNAGGEWNPQGLPLDHPSSGAQLRMATDLDGQEWSAQLVVPEGQGERWSWELWNRNELLERGSVDLPSSGEPVAEWTLPARYLGNGRLIAWRSEDTDVLPASAVRNTGAFHARFVLATPVFADDIELGFDLSHPSSAEVQVLQANGEVLASSPVDLPAGLGQVVFQANPGWPDVVRVAVVPHLEATPAVREAP